MNYYKQCRLQRGHDVMHTWIPSEFAKLKGVVKIRYNSISEWSDGWTVTECGPAISEEQLDMQYKGWKEFEHVLN
jgi:hypothetical protein